MKTFRRPPLLALLALLAALAPATALGQPLAAAGARPSAGPRSVAPSAYRAAKRKLLARGKGFVRAGDAKWIPASRLGGIKATGGMRLRAFRRARLVSVYVPETRAGVPGFRALRLYGMAKGEAPAGGSELTDKVETAYGSAIALMTEQHVTRPTAPELHEQAVRDLETVEDAIDPVATGRRGIAATVAGRDSWTRYQAPVEYQQTSARTNRAPELSVLTRRTVDGLAVVKLSSFTVKVAQEIHDELTARRPRGVVLDLRGNLGGNISEARDLLELFAVDRRVMLIERTRNGATEKVEEWRANGPGRMAGMPLVVLVDGNSASSSEILTAGLKDTGTGRIAGTLTYGKGVKQMPTQLEDGSGIRVTFGQLEGPITRWHGVGIQPDVPAADLASRGALALSQGRDHDVAGPTAAARDGDPVLAGALDELRGMMKR